MKRWVCIAIVIAAAACSAPSAEDLVRDVIAQRNNYEARLSSWIVREDAAVPFLYLDVMVINNNLDAALRTLTVMIEQLDAQDQVLDARRVAIDVAALTAGIGQSIGVQVAPAHAAVEGVRLFIEANPPRELWPEFAEFDSVRPRI